MFREHLPSIVHQEQYFAAQEEATRRDNQSFDDFVQSFSENVFLGLSAITRRYEKFLVPLYDKHFPEMWEANPQLPLVRIFDNIFSYILEVENKEAFRCARVELSLGINRLFEEEHITPTPRHLERITKHIVKEAQFNAASAFAEDRQLFGVRGEDRSILKSDREAPVSENMVGPTREDMVRRFITVEHTQLQPTL